MILIGASVRAAAMSALRAGLQPWCADLFADADLRRLCPAVRLVDDYPRGFLDILDHAPGGPCMYTGGIENWPDLVQAIAKQRPLWGHDAASLRRVRSPRRVFEALRSRALAVPRLANKRSELGRGRWLIKPGRGAGGKGIRPWETGSRVPRGCYLQEHVPGVSGSAVFVGQEKRARLFGITQQLVGCDWLHARSFKYCGSVGPWPLARAQRACLRAIGTALVQDFHLRGIFGVDFVLSPEGIPYPVEVNPRYPASVEVLELARRRSALIEHVGAFTQAASPVEKKEKKTIAEEGVIGKAILFAAGDMAMPTQGPWTKALRVPWSAWRIPEFADIPEAGEGIRKGHPILTFFARGRSCGAVVQELRESARRLGKLLSTKKSENLPEKP